MLFRVIFKNFKGSIKSYLLFFFSEMLSVTLVFSFYAMKSTVTEWANQGLTDVYMYLAVRITGYAVIAAGIFVVAFSMKYYIKVRLRDYSLFLILGMKKRMLRQFIGIEYLLGWIVSLGTGILLGNGVQILFKFAVRKYYGGQVVTISVPLEVYKYTFIISGIMILAVLAVIAVLLEERGMSNLITAEVKKERRPVNRHWLIVVLLGVLALCASYVFMNRLGWNYFNENGTYSLVGCIVGGGILMMFGGSLILERVRKNEKYYFKKIISINQLYHRFNSNIMLIFAVFAIQLVSIAYLAVNIADNMPVNQPEEKYPYDYIWFAQEKDKAYVEDFVHKYDGSAVMYPAFRVTWQWGEENIGISESTYESVAGKQLGINLTGKEIYYINQSPPKERLVAESAKKGKLPADLHIGRLREEMLTMLLWDDAWEEYYQSGYSIVGHGREELFGYFSKTKMCEDVYVFSDEYFEKEWKRIREDEEEPSIIACIQIAEQNRPTAGEQLKEYVKNNGISAAVDSYVLYSSDETRLEKKTESIMYITVSMFLMFTLYIGSVFVIGMKTLAEVPIYQKKYYFLKCMGMRKKERVKAISKEILGILNLSIIFSYTLGIGFVVRLVQVREVTAAERKVFYDNWGIVIFLYLAVQVLSNYAMRCYLVHKVEGEEKN